MTEQRKPWHHDKRSRHERGYGTAWDKLRLRILARDGYLCRCEDCAKTKRLRPATEVDHIVSKAAWLKQRGSLDGCDDDSNLAAINSDCHKAKTAREMGHRVRLRIGRDGWPTPGG